MVLEKKVGIIGAASFVGAGLLSLFEKNGFKVTVFSRKGGQGATALSDAETLNEQIENWVCLAPIWTLPAHLHFIEKLGGINLVALSSTSRFSKINSPAKGDRALAQKLIEGEEKTIRWAASKNCSVVIFQPTMIYGHGEDKNITEIANVIKRFGYFPLFGNGTGLRQPVHVEDVVNACFSAIKRAPLPKNNYILSGGEELTYREMVERIFIALDRKARFFRCPLFIVHLAVRIVTLLPSYKGLTAEVAVRMNKNQNYGNRDAREDFGFSPRSFQLFDTDM